MKLKKIVTSMYLALLSGALLTGCAGSDGSDGTNAPSADSVASAYAQLVDARKVLDTNADIAYAAYSDSVTTAIALKTAIDLFAATPTDPTLFEAAKTAWLVSREPYGQTEVYRFRNSPIDSTDYSSEDGPEGNINAWPLGEALIDYVTTGTDFGDDQVGVTEHQTGLNSGAAIIGAAITNANTIIGSNITIDSALMDNNMTAADEHDVISGYHAIEFMLWGQDLNSAIPTADTPRDATAGHRPISDFGGPTGARRLLYLQVVVDKLIADLTTVREAWAPGAAYRTAFTSVSNQAQANQKIEEILTGMGTLSEGELAGERMQIALVNNSQEDEHSCFSDNTHRDIWLNAQGVSNSYDGIYAGYDEDLNGTPAGDNTTSAVNGYSLKSYVATYGSASLANDLSTQLTATKVGYMAIDAAARTGGKPFDLQIKDVDHADAAHVKATIISLNAQASDIQAIATDLGLGDVVDDDASECTTSDPTAGC